MPPGQKFWRITWEGLQRGRVTIKYISDALMSKYWEMNGKCSARR